MRQWGMGVIIGAMMALVAACTADNPPLDQGLSNKPPYPRLQYTEKTPRLFEVAAIVDRGGAATTDDQAIFDAAVDRAIRYAARLAERHKAPQFDVLFEGWQRTGTVYTSMTVQASSTRMLMARAAVALRDADAPPATEGVRFVTHDVLARSPDRPIVLARRGFNVR